MKNKNIVIINRWNDEFANYSDYINHDVNRVIYICNESSFQYLRSNASLEIYSANLNDKAQMTYLINNIINSVGTIYKIIALSEFDLDMAAYLRTEFRVEGLKISQVELFRDKMVMKKAIKKSGMVTPKCNDLIDFHEIDKYLFPVILKPKKGAASVGVIKCVNKEDFKCKINLLEHELYEFEEFVKGKIYHIDGIVHDSEIIFFVASEYINTCLDFNNGIPLGSFILNDTDVNHEFYSYSKTVLEALSLKNGAFHLEVIRNQANELVFLEIGARVGGGEIPFLIKDLYGINMFQAWLDSELGQDIHYLRTVDKNKVGGFLMIPEMRPFPSKVINRVSLIEKIKHLYWEKIPEIGTVFDGEGGYENIGGRFRYRAHSSIDVKHDIYKSIDQYHLAVEAVS